MKTYTVDDIKAYFDHLIKRYPNSATAENAKSMEYLMFNTTFRDLDNFEKVIEKIKENA